MTPRRTGRPSHTTGVSQGQSGRKWAGQVPQSHGTGLGDSSFLPLVRQLIKSQRVQNKLGVVFEKEKDRTQRKDFIFVSARVSCCLCWGVGGYWSLLRIFPSGI